MGIYYYLLNDTKKKKLHLSSHVKERPITVNSAVHFAFINYMFENQHDSMRMISDMYDEAYEYEDCDLLEYKFANKCTMETIVEKLNKVYKERRYIVKDGLGIEIPPPDMKISQIE